MQNDEAKTKVKKLITINPKQYLLLEPYEADRLYQDYLAERSRTQAEGQALTLDEWLNTII